MDYVLNFIATIALARINAGPRILTWTHPAESVAKPQRKPSTPAGKKGYNINRR